MGLRYSRRGNTIRSFAKAGKPPSSVNRGHPILYNAEPGENVIPLHAPRVIVPSTSNVEMNQGTGGKLTLVLSTPDRGLTKFD